MILRLLSILPIVAAACGGGSGGDGGGDNGGNVTLDTLPADQRAAFETWKAQPIKDCFWVQAFPGLAKEALAGVPVAQPQPTPHVDVTALYTDTHGSPLFQGSQGEVVLLGSPIEDAGTAKNELNVTYTADGQTTRSLSVRAERTGGECVVTLGGAEVFRTRMAAAMEITAYADAASLAVAGHDLTLPVFDASNTVGALEAAPLLAHTLGALVPGDRAYAAVAARFNVDEPTSKQVFAVGAAQLPAIVRPQLDGTPAFAPDAVMYGPRAAIAPLADTSRVGLDLLFIPSASDAPTADKLLVVHTEIAIAARGSNAHATAFTVQPAIDRSDAATIACFADRDRLASAFATAAGHAPGFDAVFASCRDLALDGTTALVSDPASQQRIAQRTFTGPITSGTNYVGWDTVFLGIVDRLISAGTDLATLDPGHANAALDAALARAAAWLRAVPSAAPAELRDSVVPTSLRWTLAAVTGLAELDTLIPSTFTNAGAAYTTSVLRMMQDVTQGATTGLAAARCGANLTGDRAARVAAMLATTATLPEAQQFTDQMRGQLLQSCPDDAALVRINAAVAPARVFVTADQARAPGLAFARSVKALVARALTEGWTTDTYAVLGDLAELGIVRQPSCATTTTYSEQIVCFDPNFLSFSATTGKLLDPAHAARHATFARGYLPARQDWLSATAFASLRAIIDGQFFDRGLWTGCTDQGFAASQATLFQKLEQLRTAAPVDRGDIESDITLQVFETTCP